MKKIIISLVSSVMLLVFWGTSAMAAVIPVPVGSQPLPSAPTYVVSEQKIKITIDKSKRSIVSEAISNSAPIVKSAGFNSVISFVFTTLKSEVNLAKNTFDYTFSYDSYIGFQPTYVLPTLKVLQSTKNNGPYTPLITKGATFRWTGEKLIVSVPLKTTYYKGTVSYDVMWSDGSYKSKFDEQSYQLMNKKGLKYPSYTDSFSGMVMFEPQTDWIKDKSGNPTCGLSNTDRAKYIAWYEAKYKSKRDWSGSVTQIHHIRPCAYGGTNDYSNLIPLPTAFHQQVVTPWWANF